MRSLGPIHQLDTEISAILVEHSISVSQASQGFSEASLNEMPIDTPQKRWKPEEVSSYYIFFQALLPLKIFCFAFSTFETSFLILKPPYSCIGRNQG